MDERRKHGWPFWFAVAMIALPLLYVLSIGPAVRAVNRGILREETLGTIYSPVIRLADVGPAPLPKVILWYMGLWNDPNWVPPEDEEFAPSPTPR